VFLIAFAVNQSEKSSRAMQGISNPRSDPCARRGPTARMVLPEGAHGGHGSTRGRVGKLVEINVLEVELVAMMVLRATGADAMTLCTSLQGKRRVRGEWREGRMREEKRPEGECES
jgi:hypothetical protein